MKKESMVCAVVVSYNRKDLLIECLEALLKQTRPVEGIYIIDNASMDGTPDMLKKSGYITEIPPHNLKEPWEKEFEIENLLNKNKVKIYYLRMDKNTGGAGGFYEGVKRGYERGYEWLWLMDDDGIPSEYCLESLLLDAQKNKLMVINPLVINKEEPKMLSFGFDENILTVEDAIKLADKEGIIHNKANPFNGTLLHSNVIEKVGFIKREMFIWGDETEYFLRIRKNGFNYATSCNAKFFHPKGKIVVESIFWGIIKLPIKSSKLEMNFYRNIGYLGRKYENFWGLKLLIKYIIFFIFKKQFSKLICFLKYYFDGWMNKYKLPPNLDIESKNTRSSKSSI